MKSAAQIESQVRRFVLNNFLFTDDDGMLANDDSLTNKGFVDSTGMLEVIEFIQAEFAVRVADDEMTPENLDSVNRIVSFVSRKASAAA
jgi:acyl carrier protein